MRTLSSIMRKLLTRAKGGVGKGVTLTQATGPGVRTYNRPTKKTRP